MRDAENRSGAGGAVRRAFVGARRAGHPRERSRIEKGRATVGRRTTARAEARARRRSVPRDLERKARGNDREFSGGAHASGGGKRRVRTYLLVSQQRPQDDASVSVPRPARSALDRARPAAGPPGPGGARAGGFGTRDTIVSSPRGGAAPRVGGDARRGRARGAHAHGCGGHLATHVPCQRSVARGVTPGKLRGGREVWEYLP